MAEKDQYENPGSPTAPRPIPPETFPDAPAHGQAGVGSKPESGSKSSSKK